MNYVISLMKEIVRKRKLIWDLAKADFRKRFVGSYFGMVWMLVQPISSSSRWDLRVCRRFRVYLTCCG